MEKFIVRAIKNPKSNYIKKVDEDGYVYFDGTGGTDWRCWADRIDKAKQFLKAKDAISRAKRMNRKPTFSEYAAINAEVIKVEVEIKVIEVL